MNEEHHHHHHHHGEEPSPLPNRYLQAFGKHNLHLHDDEVAQRAAHLVEHHLSENSTPDVKRLLLGFTDVTSLRVTDTEEHVLALVEKLNRTCDERPELPVPAAVCVYPTFARLVSESLEVEGTGVACVAGGFPSAQMLPEVKSVEVALALKDGATEIDTVLPVGLFLSENYEEVDEQIDELKEICGDNTLKVILETGALQSAEQIKKAAVMAMYSGADFIKTSTGKISTGATPAAAFVMCEAIREYYELTGRRVGFKAAGGINTPADALVYYTLVKEMLGAEWLTPQLFRLGSSRLYDAILAETR